MESMKRGLILEGVYYGIEDSFFNASGLLELGERNPVSMDHNTSCHTRSIKDIFQMLEAPEQGLNPGEVDRQRKKHEMNQQETHKKKSLFAIMILIVLNAANGFWMEYRAQFSLDAFKKLDTLRVSVTRQCKVTKIDAEALVPEDLIHLEAGDLVPADARVIAVSEWARMNHPCHGNLHRFSSRRTTWIKLYKFLNNQTCCSFECFKPMCESFLQN